jgi:hypothetical protein
LQFNSNNALGNLNDLNDALNAVSDSAGKAGVNAQMARAEFTQLMDQAIKNGYGSASTNVARQEQDLKNSYGRSFQDVDASGRLSQSHAYMAASLSGISVSQYLTGGADVKAGADQVLDRATVKAALKPGVEDWIKAHVKAAGGKLDEQAATQLGQQMLQEFYPNDPYALSAVVASLSGYSNLSSDPVKAATWLVQQYNGKGALATARTDEKKTSKSNSIKTGLTTLSYPDQEQKGGFLGFGSHNSKAYDAYSDWVNERGHGKLRDDPVIDSLLNKIKGDDKTKVAVTTKSGKRVVSLADAVKNHRNELASGKAVIVEGDQAGKSVADILGKGGVDPLRDFSKEAKAADKSGESYAKWEQGGTGKEKKARQNLQITLTPEARRLLTVLDSTGVAGSSATATPPLSPYAANPSYGGE